MKKNREFFEDLNKLTGSALSSMVGVKNEIIKSITNQMQTWVKSMNFVTYEDFNAVKKLASDTQIELNELKKHLGLSKPAEAAAKQPAKKTAVKVKKRISKAKNKGAE